MKAEVSDLQSVIAEEIVLLKAEQEKIARAIVVLDRVVDWLLIGQEVQELTGGGVGLEIVDQLLQQARRLHLGTEEGKNLTVVSPQPSKPDEGKVKPVPEKEEKPRAFAVAPQIVPIFRAAFASGVDQVPTTLEQAIRFGCGDNWQGKKIPRRIGKHLTMVNYGDDVVDKGKSTLVTMIRKAVERMEEVYQNSVPKGSKASQSLLGLYNLIDYPKRRVEIQKVVNSWLNQAETA